MNIIIRLLCIAAFLVLHSTVYSHHKPMVDKQYPDPPPTIDPGPDAALLIVHVIDDEVNETTSATVCVNGGEREPDEDPYHKFSLRKSGNRHKGPIQFRQLNYYFYTSGRFEVRVPPGNATIEVMKGYEYQPAFVVVKVEKRDTVKVEIRIKKAINMQALGWYSGDTHIHMDRTGFNDDTLLTITSAKNIQYSYLLAMNTQGYDKGNEYSGWAQNKDLGDGSVYREGRYFISSGQEYRTSTLGHVTIIMPDDYVQGIGRTDNVEHGPSLAVIADQSHELNGFIGLAHGGYHRQEADGLLLQDKMDFIELLQFGGYRSLGLEGWYDFLNIGFRIPIVGACDFPYTRELGSEISYVWSESIPDPRGFAKLLSEGKSFATSGPMLFLEVDGKKPGEIINLPEVTDTTINISVSVESPLYPVRYLELIVDGRVIERLYFDKLKENYRLYYKLNVSGSCWVAARTYAEAGTDAHTNPVYIYTGNKLPFNHDSSRQILARLDGSIEEVPNLDVVERLQFLKAELTKAMKGMSNKLPFPVITN